MSKRGLRLPVETGMEGRPAEDTDGLREENRRLRRAVEELSILNDLARSIVASRGDSQAIIRKVIDQSMRAVHAEQSVVTLVDDHNADHPTRTLVRVVSSSSRHEHYHLNMALLGWMFENKRPLLSSSPASDKRLSGVRWEQSIHSILCVPLVAKSKLIGVITSYNKKSGRFTEEDQRLLSIIASQSAQIIENARLYEQERRLGEVMEQLRMAAKIWYDLLPKTSPSIPGYDITGASIPALEVGGDYFDFIPLGDGRLSVCLGDVSGKGLPAALLMANLQGTLRGQTGPDIPLASTMAQSNLLLHRSTDSATFATLFVGVLDPPTGVLTYCNAGHEYPMLFRRDGRVERLSAGGLVLGAVDTFRYEESTTVLERGDFLVMYSDGIPEAMDELGNFFGEDRLRACIPAGETPGAVELLQHVFDRVHAHEGGAPHADDLTIVVVRRLP